MGELDAQVSCVVPESSMMAFAEYVMSLASQSSDAVVPELLLLEDEDEEEDDEELELLELDELELLEPEDDEWAPLLLAEGVW